jgi:hypothetical protein
VPIIRGARLFGYLDGTVAEPSSSNPGHGAWVAKDQQLLGFINASLSREVLDHVATCTIIATVWKELNSMFSSQSRVRTIQLRTWLAMMRKGEQSAVTYYNKMKGFVDEMAAAWKPLKMMTLCCLGWP